MKISDNMKNNEINMKLNSGHFNFFNRHKNFLNKKESDKSDYIHSLNKEGIQ